MAQLQTISSAMTARQISFAFIFFKLQEKRKDFNENKKYGPLCVILTRSLQQIFEITRIVYVDICSNNLNFLCVKPTMSGSYFNLKS